MSENIRITKEMRKYIELYRKQYSSLVSSQFWTDAHIIHAICLEWYNYNPKFKNVDNDL